MSVWKRLLTRDANILLKSLVIHGIEKGPTFVLPEWRGVHNHLWSWQKGETGIHYLYSDLHVFSEVVMKKVVEDQTFGDQYKQQSKHICDEVVTKIKQLTSLVRPSMTNDELHALFSRFCDYYAELGQTILMTLEEVQEKILPTLRYNALKKDPHELLGILTTPSELSIEAEEERDRLALLEYIESVPSFKALFQKKVESIKKEIAKSEYKDIRLKIEHYVEKYCWIPLNFEKEMWDLDFFLKLLSSYITDSYNYHIRKKEIDSFSHEREEEKERLYAILRLDEKTKRLIGILNAVAYIRFYRATIFSLAFYEAFPLLKEVAKRVGVPFDVIKYYTPHEIGAALLAQETLSANRGRARRDSFVILVRKGKYEYYEGDEAQQVLNREYPQEEIKKSDILKGMCAYPGKVHGRVKLVFDAREMDKLKKGDILVCKETNPDLVIVMGRAAAIITDEGGITSHAAIVSREMKKPCIIGTKVATKIFRDDDLVEVDAEKGIVRILL